MTKNINRFRVVLFMGLTLMLSKSGAAHRYDDLATVDARKHFLIDSMASWANSLSIQNIMESDGFGGGKYGAFPAMALFEKGEIEKARAMASQQVEGGAAMFREFGTMTLYMEYNHLYTEELKLKIKENQLNSDFFKVETNTYPNDPSQSHRFSNIGGASENHKLMYAAAAYLAGIAWPDEYPKEWFKAGYDHLIGWFNIVTSVGFWEEDSPTYLIHHMGPVLSVYEYAPKGSEMKNRAKMVLDWYFLSVAGEYLKGYWITPSARDHNPLFGMTNSAESTALFWLYFGDNANVPYPHVHSTMYHWKAAIHFAISDYEIPEIIQKIATDRDKPYVHREYMAKNPMDPKEYCYITPTYGMASILHDNGNPPDDMTRWKVQWVPLEPEMEPTVFLLKHPALNQKWEIWRGASKFEQTIQEKGSLLAVYNIREGEKAFIDGPYHPKAYKLMKQHDDWWFFHTGNMLMAVKAAKGLEIIKKRKILHNHGKKMRLRVMRSNGLKNALIVHTECIDKYKGDFQAQLNSFMQNVLKNSQVDFSGVYDQNPQASFVTPEGTSLHIIYEGEKIVNGNILNPADFPMFENPWMHQEIKKGILTLTHQNSKVVYDFNDWTIREF